MNNVGSFLSTVWYPIFLPTCTVKKFTVKGWKVIVINSGEDINKPLLCRRPCDGKEMHIGYNQLFTRFIDETTFIKMADHYHYGLIEKGNAELTFQPYDSKA